MLVPLAGLGQQNMNSGTAQLHTRASAYCDSLISLPAAHDAHSLPLSLQPLLLRLLLTECVPAGVRTACAGQQELLLTYC